MIADNLWELLDQGGVVIYPLLACSIASVAVVIERAWVLSRGSRGARRLHGLVERALRESGVGEARAVCRQDRSPLAPVYLEALGHAGDRDEAERRTRRGLGRLQRRLRGPVWLLGTVGSLAPFIGLLGTVIGIIRAFDDMAETGSGGFTVVAAGISEALIATAAGLLVGVVSIFAYNAFMVRIQNLSAELREQSDDLLHLIEPQAGPEDVHRVVSAQ